MKWHLNKQNKDWVITSPPTKDMVCPQSYLYQTTSNMCPNVLLSSMGSLASGPFFPK